VGNSLSANVKRIIGHAYLALVLTVMLGGCAGDFEFVEFFESQQVEQNVGVGADENAVIDPILLAVASGTRFGDPVDVTDLETGAIYIVVVASEYHSASGRVCRRYDVLLPNDGSIGTGEQVACSHDGVWQRVSMQ